MFALWLLVKGASMKMVKVTVELFIKTDPEDEVAVEADILQGVIDAIEDGTLDYHLEEDEEDEEDFF